MELKDIKREICKLIDEIRFPENETIILQIQKVLRGYNGDDFQCVEEIVEILEKNGFDCGNCHDF